MFSVPNDGFTDRKLVNAMNRLSNDGIGAYTEQQLLHALATKRVVKPGVFSRFSKSPKVPRYSASSFDAAHFGPRLQQWRQSGGMVVGRLLDAAAIAADSNRQAGTPLSPQMTPHSFDRVVMVDTAETAVMLIANNFHVDQRCVVISEDGYPEAFRDPLVNLLRENPNLVVAVLHDASIAGAGMAERAKAWFPGPTVRILEVGLRPRHAIKGNLHVDRSDKRKLPDETLLADAGLGRYELNEREWLAWGLSSPLGALSPKRTMNVLADVFNSLAMFDERRSNDDDDGGYDDYDYIDNRDGVPMMFWLDDIGSDSGSNSGSSDGFAKGFASFDDGDGVGFDGGDFDGDG